WRGGACRSGTTCRRQSALARRCPFRSNSSVQNKRTAQVSRPFVYLWRVGAVGLEPTTPKSQTWCATDCATPRITRVYPKKEPGGPAQECWLACPFLGGNFPQGKFPLDQLQITNYRSPRATHSPPRG